MAERKVQMTFDPIIAFCKQRLSDLGATSMAGTIPQHNITATQAAVAESNRRATAELQMVIMLCEGLNRVTEYMPDQNYRDALQQLKK